MTTHTRGRRFRLSCNRSLVIDLLDQDRQVPRFVHSRVLALGPLAEARDALPQRIGWPVLFLRAYALLSLEFPQLRQCYLTWPWPHVYEHPHSVGSLVISRPFEGEDRLCWVRFPTPEIQPLAQLQQVLTEGYLAPPVAEVFHRQIFFSRLPGPLRRLVWWTTLHLSGGRRCKRFGTFGLTTIAALGAEIERPPSPLTTTLTYGPLDGAGRTRAAISYDHRLMDGLLIARCLARLEAILLGDILTELKAISAQPGPARSQAA